MSASLKESYEEKRNQFVNTYLNTGSDKAGAGGQSGKDAGTGTSGTGSTSTSSAGAAASFEEKRKQWREKYGLDREKSTAQQDNPTWEEEAKYITSWLQDANSYVSDLQYLKDGISYSMANNQEGNSKRYAAGKDLADRADIVVEYLNKNRDLIGEEQFRELIDSVQFFRSERVNSAGLLHSAQSFYSNWDTEDAYNQFVADREEYERKRTSDTKALGAEIEDLQAKLGDKTSSEALYQSIYDNSWLQRKLDPEKWAEIEKNTPEYQLRQKQAYLEEVEAIQALERMEGYQQKYKGKSYNELQDLLQKLDASGEEYAWLKEYAPSAMRPEDYDQEIRERDTEIASLEKLLEDARVIRNGVGSGGDEEDARLSRELALLLAQSGYESFSDAENRLEKLQAEKYSFQKGKEYSFLEENPDFDDNSSAASDKRTAGFGTSVGAKWFGQGDLVYDYINDIDGARDRESMTTQDGRTPYNIYDYMEEDEVKKYNYLHNTQGKEAANAYLEYLQNTLDQRKMSDVQKYSQKFADEHPYISSAYSVPANLVSGAGFLDVAAQNAARKLSGEYKPIDYNRSAMAPSVYTSTVRSTVAQKIADQTGTINLDTEKHPVLSRVLNGRNLGDVYQLGMSMADSAAVAALAPAIGSAGTVLLGGSAATQGMLDAVAAGATDSQALAMGFLNGTFEMLFEKYSLETLLNTDAGSLVQKTLKQMLAEGSEEFFTSVANAFADTMVMADKSDFRQRIAAYMADGLSQEQAAMKAFEDIAISIGWDFVGGAITGGIMGAAAQPIQNYLSLNAEGRNILDASGGADALMRLAMEMSGASSESVRKSLNDQSNRLKELTNSDKASDSKKAVAAGKLYRTVSQAVTEQNQADIVKSLTRKGFTEERANAIAKAAALSVNGEELTRKQKNLLQEVRSDSRVQKTIADIIGNEKSTVAFRTGNLGAFEYGVANGDVSSFVDASRTKQTLPGRENGNVEGNLTTKDSSVSDAIYEASEDGKTYINSTGEPVEIREVADIRDGEMILRLEDGRVVSAGDITYANRDEALIYGTVAEMGASVQSANILINSFKNAQKSGSSITASEYAHGILDAFKYGKFGIPQQELANSTFASKLTAAQQDYVYRQGRKAAGKQTAKEQASVSRKPSVQGNEKTVDASKEGKQGQFHFDRKGRTFDDVRETSLRAMEQLSSALGVDFYVFESYLNGNGERVYRNADGKEVKAPNGWYDQRDGSIHIDLNAGMDGKGTMLFTVSHELTHFIRQWSPAKFKVLSNFLMAEYGRKGVSVISLVQEQISKAKRNGRDITFDEAHEEMVADSMETMLSDGKVAEKLAKLKQQDRSLWQKMKDFITDLAQKIRMAYAKLKPDSAEGRIVAEMKDSIEKLQELFAEALVDASENYWAAEVKESTAQKGGEIRYSVIDGRLTAESTEQDRYELLKNATIEAAKVNAKAIQNVNLEDYNTRKKSTVVPGFRALARQLGILNVNLQNSEIGFPFQFSRKNLDKSLHHQLEYGGTYQDYVKALSCFNELVKNAIPIEIHSEKKKGTIRENPDLKYTYVLVSAYQDGNSIVPVQFEVKEFFNYNSGLYLSVVLTKIDLEVVEKKLSTQGGSMSSLVSKSIINLQQLFEKVNPKDGRFLKYVPDGFLNDAQKQAKQEALRRQEEEYASYEASKRSDRDPEMAKVNRVLEQENAKLREDVVSLKELLKLQRQVTGGTKFTRSSVEAAAGVLMKAESAKGNKAELARILNGFYEYIAKSEELSWEDIREQAKPVVQWLQEHADWRPAQDYAYDADLTQQDMTRQVYESYWNVSTLHTVADVKQRQIDRLRGEHLARMEKVKTTHKEQVAKLKQEHKAELQKVRKEYRDSAVKKQNEIIDKYQKAREKNVEGRKRTAIRNQIKGLSEKFHKMATAPSKSNTMHAPVGLTSAVAAFCDVFAESEERAAVRMAGELDERRAALAKDIEKNGERNASDKESGIIDGKNARIAKTAEKLKYMRKHYAAIKADPTLGMYYDEHTDNLIKELSDELSGTDIYEMSSEQLKTVYNTMRSMMNAIVNANKVISAGKDKTLVGMANKMASEIDQVNTRTNGAEIILRRYLQWQMSPDTFFDYACGFIKDNEGKVIQKMFSDGTKRMIGVQREFYNRFQHITETKNAKDAKDLRDMMMRPMKDMVDWGLKDADGNSVKTSRGMMLQAYMLLTQEDSLDSLSYGGFKLPRADAYYNGKIDAAYGDAKESSMLSSAVGEDIRELKHQIDSLKDELNADNLSETQKEDTKKNILELEKRMDAIAQGERARLLEMRETIGKSLTPMEKDLVNTAAEWYRYTGTLLTEVFEQMHGYRPNLVENYVPIHRDLTTVKTDIRETDDAFNLENSGFTKERVKSHEPILLTDFFTELSNQQQRISRYYGFAQVQKDFNRLWNLKLPGMRSTLESKVAAKYGSGDTRFGVSGTKYVENYIKDVSGSNRGNSVLDTFYGRAASATLSLNPRVAFSQLASIPTASAVVGWKSMAVGFAKGIGTSISTKNKNQLAQKSEWFFQRYRGEGGITEIADLKANSGLWDRVSSSKVGKWLFNWCQNFDVFATASMWAMAEDYVQSKGTKKDAEGYNSAVEQVYEDIIRKTQPNYTTTERSDLLRDKRAGMKILTMYKTQSNQNLNILLAANGEFIRAKQDLKAGRNGVTSADVKEAGGKLANAITSVTIGGTLTFVALRTIVNLLMGMVNPYRDDETDEVTMDGILKGMGKEMLSSLSGMFALGGQLYDAVNAVVSRDRYYGISDSAISLIADAFDTTVTTLQKLTDPEEDLTWEQIDKQISALLTAAGVPYDNAKKFIDAAKMWYNDIKNGTFGQYTREATTDNQYRARFVNAFREGDAGKCNDILAYFLSKSDAPNDIRAEKELQSGFKDYLKDQFVKEKVTAQEVTDILRDYLGMDTEEIKSALNQWQGIVDTGKTVSHEEEAYLKREVSSEEYTEYLIKYSGKSQEDAVSAERRLRCERDEGIAYGDIKDLYIHGELSGSKASEYLLKYGDISSEDVEQKLREWEFEKKYDIAWSDKKEAYLDGEIKSKDLRDALIRFGGKTEEDADAYMEDLDFEKNHHFAYSDRKQAYLDGEVSAGDLKSILIKQGGYTQEEAAAQIEAYDWEKEGISDVTKEAVQDYIEYCKDAGVSREDFIRIRRFSNNTRNDVDENGQTIYYSAMKKVMSEIDSLNISNAQKTALARSLGWKESNIEKYKLW